MRTEIEKKTTEFFVNVKEENDLIIINKFK